MHGPLHVSRKYVKYGCKASALGWCDVIKLTLLLIAAFPERRSPPSFTPTLSGWLQYYNLRDIFIQISRGDALDSLVRPIILSCKRHIPSYAPVCLTLPPMGLLSIPLLQICNKDLLVDIPDTCCPQNASCSCCPWQDSPCAVPP